METCNYLLYLALILMCTKFLGLLTRRARMPQVVGALLAGLLLGPAVFKIIPQTEFLTQTAEVGVVILMFCAGMETDVKELKKCGKAATIIAVIGVLVPLAGGFATAWFFNRPGMIESNVSTSLVLQNVFIGVILTATSVSITVETLKELGKLNSAAGNAILGAAVIDDILGIIALTVITSMADPTVKLWVVLVKIVGFFVFAAVAGFLFYKFFNYYSNRTKNGLQRYVIISFVFCLLMSYVAEEFFGVADITGAYVAGLVVSMIQKEDYLASRFSTLSYLYLSPIFFASIGLKVVIPQMSATIDVAPFAARPHLPDGGVDASIVAVGIGGRFGVHGVLRWRASRLRRAWVRSIDCRQPSVWARHRVLLPLLSSRLPRRSRTVRFSPRRVFRSHLRQQGNGRCQANK